jgi:glutamate carboxypeptidase
MPTDPLLEHLTARLPDSLDALRQLVQVNSFTENRAGVELVGDLTAELFAPLGFRAERVPSADPRYARHLLLRRPGLTPRHVALVSHSDTVFTPQEEADQGFAWRDEGERIYGPGMVDIKGGTVVAFMALDGLRAAHPEAFDALSWLVALDAAEEQLRPDFAALCRARLPREGALACLIFESGANVEPGRCPLVVARKGQVNFRVEVEGQAAHAGTNFWRGRNAILAAARLALELAAVSDRGRDLTVNVGTVAGGTVTNRVPHRCTLQGELRAFDPAVLREGMGRLRRLVAAAGNATLTFRDELPPWPLSPGSERLLATWQRAGAALGLRVTPGWRAGVSDGNLLWDHAPTLDGLGPVGGNCHCSQRGPDGTWQEYALRASFVPRAALTATALRELARGGVGRPGGDTVKQG